MNSAEKYEKLLKEIEIFTSLGQSWENITIEEFKEKSSLIKTTIILSDF